jgi:cytoskeletal protein RodZ
MTAREAFGARLRRQREQHRITLADLAVRTKVQGGRWARLEQGDMRGWPTGLFARSYVRQYAEIVGLDPADTVDQFCELFCEGDRRAEPLPHEATEGPVASVPGLARPLAAWFKWTRAALQSVRGPHAAPVAARK